MLLIFREMDFEGQHLFPLHSINYQISPKIFHQFHHHKIYELSVISGAYPEICQWEVLNFFVWTEKCFGIFFLKTLAN